MVANKISEKLAKILAKEITNIELPISNFTSDNSLDFSDDKEKQNKTQQSIKKNT